MESGRLIGNLMFYLFITMEPGNGEIFNRNSLILVLVRRVMSGRFAQTELRNRIPGYSREICNFLFVMFGGENEIMLSFPVMNFEIAKMGENG